jgi:endonuclease/exonuclease/phosphatase family metal-dependent hydrolase
LSTFVFIFSLSAKEITVMNYNVENLFDTLHDEGKKDYTYLPLSVKKKSRKIQKYCHSLAKESWKKSCLFTDWNKNVLHKKLKNIARVITAYNGGADIVVLQEVENINVLRMLVTGHLQDYGYKYMSLIEGADQRGIDNAIISRYKISSTALHNFSLKPYSNKKTRGIFEANIVIDNKKIKFLANHWPSQGSVAETRLIASAKLAQIARFSDADLTIALGDFNTLDKDHPHGIKRNILPLFIDAHTQALKLGVPLLDGSHWFKGHWSRLDRVFILKNSNLEVNYRSFNIFSKPFMLGKRRWTDWQTGEVTVYDNVPLRFDNKSAQGYSDHLPLVFAFSY